MFRFRQNTRYTGMQYLNIYIYIRSFKTVAIDILGGKRSLVKNIIAQTTILKRAIKK